MSCLILNFSFLSQRVCVLIYMKTDGVWSSRWRAELEPAHICGADKPVFIYSCSTFLECGIKNKTICY